MSTTVNNISITNSLNNNISFKKFDGIAYDSEDNLKLNTFENYKNFFILNNLGYPDYYHLLENISNENVIKDVYDNGLDYDLPNCITLHQKLQTIEEYQRVFYFANIKHKASELWTTSDNVIKNGNILDETLNTPIFYNNADYNIIGDIFNINNIPNENYYNFILPNSTVNDEYTLNFSGFFNITSSLGNDWTSIFYKVYLYRYFKKDNIEYTKEYYLGTQFYPYITPTGNPACLSNEFYFDNIFKIYNDEIDNRFRLVFTLYYNKDNVNDIQKYTSSLGNDVVGGNISNLNLFIERNS